MIKIHQNYVTLLTALGFGLIIGLSGYIWNAPDLWQRMVFGAALYLLSKDVIAGAAIDKGKRSLTNLNRWIYAFYLTGYFGLFMLLFVWRGMDGMMQILPGVALGAALFGLILSFGFETKTFAYMHQFETDAPAGSYGLLCKLWPVLSLFGIYLLTCGMAKVVPMFFVAIGLWFLLPRYTRVANGSVVWANLPRLTGMALLIAALLAELA